jgi:hypothetical protein
MSESRMKLRGKALSISLVIIFADFFDVRNALPLAM